MHNWLIAILACVVLSVPAGVHAAPVPPVPETPLQAQWALGFNPRTRCPDLRIADAGTMAVLVFWLPSSGIPSHVSIKSSSGSDALDSATINCVSKLRFAAATTLGNGDPIDSWQQIALTWATRAPERNSGRTAEIAANDAKRDDAGGLANNVTVHVCVDAAGKLQGDPTVVQSSGMPSFDEAAVRIAASGSAYYRPHMSAHGPPASGCAQLAIEFDTK